MVVIRPISVLNKLQWISGLKGSTYISLPTVHCHVHWMIGFTLRLPPLRKSFWSLVFCLQDIGIWTFEANWMCCYDKWKCHFQIAENERQSKVQWCAEVCIGSFCWYGTIQVVIERIGFHSLKTWRNVVFGYDHITFSVFSWI